MDISSWDIMMPVAKWGLDEWLMIAAILGGLFVFIGGLMGFDEDNDDAV